MMMPIIAHNLFEAMQVSIGAIHAFTKCVLGVQANRAKAEGWLDRNAIVVTALNPLIGYAAGAALVKEALAANQTIREVALEKIARGELVWRESDKLITADDIETALSDLRKLTDGGITGISAGG